MLARTHYRAGWMTVLIVLTMSALVCALTVSARPGSANVRGAHSLEGSPLPLGDFQFQERSGKAVSQADLKDRVWICSFIFTRCPSSCPRISATMKSLQSRLKGAGVQLVSVSVDPRHDTPDVLARYANGLGAEADAWWFLTGDHDAIFHWIRDRFALAVQDAPPEQVAQGLEEVAHSSRLALVDRGNRVVGYFASDDAGELDALVTRAERLSRASGSPLPAVNAGLNAACAVLLLCGWTAIRSRRARLHITCMVAALAVSAVFLTCYLVYHFVVVGGSVPFRAVGRPIRTLYFTILLSHTILAVVLVPLIVETLRRAWLRRFDRHMALASITFPVWLYVSVTGVIVYWMLYRIDFASVAPAVVGV